MDPLKAATWSGGTVGVAGLGLLGRGIATCLLAHRIPVMAYARTQQEFAEARTFIARAVDESITHAGFDESLRSTWSEGYLEADSPAQFAQCTFAIESIVEDFDAKTKLFGELEEVLPPDAPIASNTSAIPISRLQGTCRHPGRVLGMHWAVPAYGTRFLELIRGEATNDASLSMAARLASSIGKDPCVVGRDIPGFLANRLAYAMYREACNLLALGIADAATIDKAFRNSVGLWAGVCGPLQWIDLTGGPALYGKAMTDVLPTLSNEIAVPEPLATKMREGATGIGNGEGFYRWTPAAAKQLQGRYRGHVWRMHGVLKEASESE